MHWYTLSKLVPPGDGEYGTAERTIYDGMVSFEAACKLASAAVEPGSSVRIFRGKNVGRLVATMEHGNILRFESRPPRD
jgi:hypothetical protein